MSKTFLRGSIAIALAVANWFGKSEPVAAAACWGHGVTCATDPIPHPCSPFEQDCGSPAYYTWCKPNSSPAWTWCVPHNSGGQSNQYCDLGEFCTC